MDAQIIDAEAALTSGLLVKYMGRNQRSALLQALQGEEGVGIAKIVLDMKHRIETMPEIRGQEGVEDQIVFLHYFFGAANLWVTEKDVGGEVLQAFGLANLFGGIEGAEWGYIPIGEAVAAGLELDLYWSPCTVSHLHAKHEESKHAWETEPNMKIWIDQATGLKCAIVRHSVFGSLCGYVRLPAKSRNLRHRRSVFDGIDVHGGVTFVDRYRNHHKMERGYWVGFDCAHSYDLIPSLPQNLWRGATYRDMAYVTENCTRLAAQIKAIADKGGR